MTQMDSNIIIFTESFPYPRDQFFEPELPYLDALFKSIVIVPKRLIGRKKEVAPHITIDISLGELMKHPRIIQVPLKTFFFVFTSFEFYKEIIKKPGQILHIDSFIRLMVYFGDAIRTKKWVLEFIDRNNIDLAKTIFYTYWLDERTMGIVLAKKKYSNIKIVSRAHGYDLFNERATYSYIPYRPEIFGGLNKVYTASVEGKQYLSQKYPTFIDKFEVALLGINDPGFITKSSQDNIFRIVSCSYLFPVKRIDLLIRGLKELGETEKICQFEWVHIGDGPLQRELEDLARKILPENVTYSFLGFLPNVEVINFYNNNPVDVFINTSESEGTPVSIMEAQSCGIPVIASAVGGNKEIVNEKVGILLSANPTPNEIADAIIWFVKNPGLTKKMKYFSKINYEEKYDANKNFQSFAKELKKLVL